MKKEFRHQGWSDEEFISYHEKRAREGDSNSKAVIDTHKRLEQARLYRATIERGQMEKNTIVPLRSIYSGS